MKDECTYSLWQGVRKTGAIWRKKKSDVINMQTLPHLQFSNNWRGSASSSIPLVLESATCTSDVLGFPHLPAFSSFCPFPWFQMVGYPMRTLLPVWKESWVKYESKREQKRKAESQEDWENHCKHLNSFMFKSENLKGASDSLQLS